jgi:LPS-assembly protein
MRFRHIPLTILLQCFLAHHCYAGEDVLDLRTDPSPPIETKANQGLPTVIEADKLEGQNENQIEATGGATLRQGGQSISADRLLLKQDSQVVDAQGAVVLEQDGNTMSGPHLIFNLNSSAGTMEKPKFYLKENDARGSADILEIQDSQHFKLENATYTTCPAGNQDWLLKMGTLEIDRTRQIGTAWNASINFKGVPILYSPWMDFPLNSQRKSGFLAPVFGGTTTGGSELTLPYYWNIAPNLDATIAPRFMTKRGLMLNNEFRYLGDRYGGELHANVLPDDAITNTTRALFSLNHAQSLTGRLNGYVNYTHVWDNDYFRDLGVAVNTTSQVNLLQEVGLGYRVGEWTSNMRVQRYQTLQDPAAPIIEPYARLPQLTVGTQQDHSGVKLAFAGEYVDFSHPTKVSGSRLVLNPSVSYPLISDSPFYLMPKVALHSTNYVMGANNLSSLPNASRTLPIMSMDSGVALERESNMFGGDYQQTFEPRAFYVYVPYKNQSALPNYDSALADFNFTQIFTENRFSGSDRIGDADQITFSATSRLLEKTSGAERLKVMLAERFSWKNPQVNLGAPTTSNGKSNILLAASGKLSRMWSLDSEFHFDPNQSHTQYFNVTAQYHPEAGKVFNMGYRFQRDTLRQVDFSTQWPLLSRWDLVGRWNYSLQDAQILEAIAGLEYNQSCWTLRLVAQRFATATQQTNTSFFLQLELNELVKVGSDPLSLLKQSVLGYTKLNESTASEPAPVLH